MARRRPVTFESSSSSESDSDLDFSSASSRRTSPNPSAEKSASSTEPLKGRNCKRKSLGDDNNNNTKSSECPRCEELSYAEHAQDPGEIHLSGVHQVVITAIRATDLTLGLRRIPAGFLVVVRADGAEYRTSNKSTNIDQTVVEWHEHILLPCEPSSKVRVSVYASFELGPMQQALHYPMYLRLSLLRRVILFQTTGGMDLYVNQFGLQNHDAFYTNNEILTAFQNYTQQIVLRYLNSPAVFSWELANDARCNGTLPTSPTCTTQTITQWHAEMAAFIASIDSNHIVSAGTSGFQCTDCPKLYPITPTASPTPSPAPGKKRNKVTPLTKEQIIRQRAESRHQNRATAKRAGTLKEGGVRIRGRWVSTATREVSSSIGPTTDGSTGVDSQDILNIPNIGFGSFQVFPDQNSYAPDDPNLSLVQNKIQSSLTWIQQSAQSAAAVGKPVVLNGFGLVTQSNLNDFVPFNMTYAPYAPDTAVTARSGFAGSKRQSSSSDYADNSDQESGYSSFLQMGNSAGLAGVMQYQWGSTGVTQTSSTIQLDELDTTDSPASGATLVASPNDGYSIANNPAIQQILQQGAQAMAQNS
ncbi:glycoside hydrolase superfamily [Suillus plorans]|uniref:mannan endo-1,4-beta-mannosidase n=1 Tax=Suillus plorans TaxID=116603 RepID=A0A9P7DAH9_9AGAM|nr:glycoside hydrolase superfamily [Suillus plorans]KAG1785012.1 glycoside hydrolase superfamily [Suillus plorans]